MKSFFLGVFFLVAVEALLLSRPLIHRAMRPQAYDALTGTGIFRRSYANPVDLEVSVDVEAEEVAAAACSFVLGEDGEVDDEALALCIELSNEIFQVEEHSY